MVQGDSIEFWILLDSTDPPLSLYQQGCSWKDASPGWKLSLRHRPSWPAGKCQQGERSHPFYLNFMITVSWLSSPSCQGIVDFQEEKRQRQILGSLVKILNITRKCCHLSRSWKREWSIVDRLLCKHLDCSWKTSPELGSGLMGHIKLISSMTKTWRQVSKNQWLGSNIKTLLFSPPPSSIS